jgi:hypothetical protein
LNASINPADERSPVEAFPDLASISDDEIHDKLRELEREEERVSYRRRRLHAQIDALRLERTIRLRRHVEAGDAMAADAAQVALAVTRPDGPLEDVGSEEREPAPIPEPASLSDGDLRELLGKLEHEEAELSFHRRILHGRIDILRAERMARAQRGHLDLDKLREVLAENLVFKKPDGGE